MTARATSVTADTMRFGLWLILKADGAARMTRTMPSLARDERSMFVNVTVPRSIFRAPELRADITIAEPRQQAHIDVEAASAALRSALGVDIDLKIATPEEDR